MVTAESTVPGAQGAKNLLSVLSWVKNCEPWYTEGVGADVLRKGMLLSGAVSLEMCLCSFQNENKALKTRFPQMTARESAFQVFYPHFSLNYIVEDFWVCIFFEKL